MRPSLLLDFEVIAQTGALNTQDEFSARMIELKIAKVFSEQIIEQSA